MKYKIRYDLKHPTQDLYRIEALKDFKNAKKGTLGGWVANEDNLSQEGNCWVFEGATVSDNGKVLDNAKLCGRASVFGNGILFGNAIALGETQIFEDGAVGGRVFLHCKAKVFGQAKVEGDAALDDSAWVSGNAKVRHALIRGDSEVAGDAVFYDRVVISGCARIFSTKDYQIVQGAGRQISFYRMVDDTIGVTVGCRDGITIDEFEDLCYLNEFGDYYGVLPTHRKEYLAFIDRAREFFKVAK